MTEVMMMLGSFQFSLSTAVYQSLRHRAEYRWPAQERVGRLPARQFTGPGNETVEMPGVIYPHFRGGTGQIEKLRAAAGQGKPLALVDSKGKVWGQFCIESVEETHTEMLPDGTPRKIEFMLQLVRYGEDG